MAELHDVEEWLGALLSQLEPAMRTKMLREVARDVRHIQQNNITLQRSPDGVAWEPRRVTARTKPGRIRRKMFQKLKTNKFLRCMADSDKAEVFFTYKARRLAFVHHYGLRETINGRGIKYHERPLLGFSDDGVDNLKFQLEKWLNLN